MAQEQNHTEAAEGRPTENGEMDAARPEQDAALIDPPSAQGSGRSGGMSAADIEASGTDGAGTGGVGDDVGGSGAVRPGF